MLREISLLVLSASTAALGGITSPDNYTPRNSQAPNDHPPAAEDVAKGWKLPPGFVATLFASEPMVRQPIDMKLDDRGRLWVAESYSYKEWQKKGEDRITIFEDTDNDGIADSRKVFRSGFHHLSSLELGFGGVWVLDTPNLMFIPDANLDDVPDGEATVLLDGWTATAGHNVANGLMWGPEGWLYGRHGITQPSLVGKPGTPEAARTFVEPGIWRFNPVRKTFEMVVRGTTNPWGLDWDEHGELFMSNNVNGHLWHVIPGALYERMFGAGSVPYDFERLHMIGERPHYPSSGDWKADWSKSEKGRDTTSDLGGGHSHCGLMIYQGDNWGAEHRGRFFMNNTHGRRINEESVERNGATYLSKHVGDIAVANTQWFRGVSLLCGPDGGVYVSDWCDSGECHDDDGVHRTSGRIYKITRGKPTAPTLRGGLRTWSDEELVGTIGHQNVWYYRHAQRLIFERAQAGKLKSKTIPNISNSPPQELQSLWMRHVAGLISRDELVSILKQHASPHLRLWAARLLTDDAAAPDAIIAQAAVEKDLLVLGHLAGLTSRLSPDDGWKLISTLSQKPQTHAPVLELLVWYAIEPIVGKFPDRAASIISQVSSPKVRQFIARRLASTMDDPAFRNAVGSLLGTTDETALAGVMDGLAGRKNIAAPSQWSAAREALLKSSPVVATQLGLAFGDSTILDLLRTQLADQAAPAPLRNQALQALATAVPPDLSALVTTAFAEPALRLSAIRAAQFIQDNSVSTRIINEWKTLTADEKSAAVDVLSTRIPWAMDLLAQVKSGTIPRNDISLGQARQLSLIKQEKFANLLAEAWGKVGSTSEEKQQEIAKLKSLLATAPKGNPDRGKPIYTKLCATCHTLFDEGGKLGPNLTGSGRKDADYILLNVIDPNANVARDYQMTVITLKDGQILAGTIPKEDEKTVTLQTITDRRILERSACQKIERQPISWMPEGLFQQLSPQDLTDLLAYLGK